MQSPAVVLPKKQPITDFHISTTNQLLKIKWLLNYIVHVVDIFSTEKNYNDSKALTSRGPSTRIRGILGNTTDPSGIACISTSAQSNDAKYWKNPSFNSQIRVR